jgi:hypothetical protein
MSDRAAAVPFKFYDLTLMVDGLISTSARLTRIEPSADRRGSNRFISRRRTAGEPGERNQEGWTCPIGITH